MSVFKKKGTERGEATVPSPPETAISLLFWLYSEGAQQQRKTQDSEGGGVGGCIQLNKAYKAKFSTIESSYVILNHINLYERLFLFRTKKRFPNFLRFRLFSLGFHWFLDDFVETGPLIGPYNEIKKGAHMVLKCQYAPPERCCKNCAQP